MDQHPMTVHGRMPIEATIKRRVHLARITDIILVVNRVIELVRIFFLNAFQSERGEVRSLRLSKRKRFTRRLCSARNSAKRQGCNEDKESQSYVHGLFFYHASSTPLFKNRFEFGKD